MSLSENQGIYPVNGFELYTPKPTRCDSANELKTPTNEAEFVYPVPPAKLQVGYKRGRRNNLNDVRYYGSLERNSALRNRRLKSEPKHKGPWYETSLDSYTTTCVEGDPSSSYPAHVVGSPRANRRQNIQQLQKQYGKLALDSDQHLSNGSKNPDSQTALQQRLRAASVEPDPRVQNHSQQTESLERSDSGYNSIESTRKLRSHSADPRHVNPAAQEVVYGLKSPTHSISSSASDDSQPRPFQPFQEVTKPYELADFYKYSSKIRQQNSREALQVPCQEMAPPQVRAERENSPQTQSTPASPFSARKPKAPPPYAVASSSIAHLKGHNPRHNTEHVPGHPPGWKYTVNSPRLQVIQGVAAHSPAVHQNHIQYTPPQPMTCEPLRASHSVNNSNNK